MTGLQELEYDILELVKQLAGKRLEKAMAMGERDLAQGFQREMYQATLKQREFRIACAEQGGCFFDAAGGVDAAALKTLAGGAN